MFSAIKNLFFKNTVDTSPKLTVDKTDWKKVFVHAVIVGAAAVVTVVGEYIANVDFGSFNAMIVPIVSSVLITVQKWLKENDVQP